MGEKMGKVLKEPPQEMAQQDNLMLPPEPQYPPQQMPQQAMQAPPQQYWQYPPSPAYDPNYPYSQRPTPPPMPQQQRQRMVPADVFKMEKTTEGQREFRIVTLAVDEKLADCIRFGRLALVV